MKNINVHFPTVELDEYVIMPNHVHVILILNDTNGRADPSPTVSSVMGWLKYNITRDVNLKSEERLFNVPFLTISYAIARNIWKYAITYF